MNELLISLLLEEEWDLIDEHLESCPEQVLDFIVYLDDSVAEKNPPNKIKMHLTNDKMPEMQRDKLYAKLIGKFITRLCNKFDIPFDSCKNLIRFRTFGWMKKLIRKKYGKKSISNAVFNDWIYDTINNHPDLLSEFLGYVALYDPKESLKWAKHFGVPEDQYPYEVETYLKNLSSQMDDGEENLETTQIVTYHSLALSLSDVVFVDDIEIFKDQVVSDLGNCSIVGVDSEWKVSFGTRSTAVSLIQIATRTKIFIFDVFALNGFQDVWNFLYDRIFNNTDVVKIGLCLDNDCTEISASVPGLRHVKYGGLGYLEISHLRQAVLKVGAKMPHPKNNPGEGLSSITEECFDLPLDKSEQCSNWEKRPLRQSQFEYAALDAFVLLEIYEVYRKLCSDLGVDFEELCRLVMIR